MARREFSKDVKRQAHARADGCCEGLKADGTRCNGALLDGRFHYDHNIPDALGGEPELWNCVVLCIPCHSEKTAKRDVPMIAKAKRVADRQIGIKKRSSFAQRKPQRSASRPIERRSELS